MSTLWRDLGYAVRTLAKQAGFSVIVIATLALGIGANTAIFSIVNAVLLRPLPYPAPDRVVMIWSHWTDWPKTWVSEPELAAYRNQVRSLADVGAFQYAAYNLTGSGEPIRVRAATVQAPVFAAIGARPIAGRVFGADEDRPGHDRVAVLNETLWRSHFAADPHVVGRTLSLDGVPYTIVGVLPAALRLPLDYGTRTPPLVWVPLALGPPDPADATSHGLYALGRLAPGATLRQAQAEVDTVVTSTVRQYAGAYDPDFGASLVPAPQEVFGGVSTALVLLLCAVGAVLLVACANVTNLMLARSEARRKELAIRTVLGAGRGRLARQLLTEALVLSTAGGAAGLVVAGGLTRGLAALAPLKLPRIEQVGLDARVLGFAALVSIATAVLFGVVPAVQAARSDPQPALKAGGREAHAGAGRLRRALVVGEIAVSMVLVAAALLVARSFGRLMSVDAGFSAERVLTFRTSLPPVRYATGADMVAAYRNIGRELRALPLVNAAGGVAGLPLASTRGSWGIRIEGRPTHGRHLMDSADWQVVTPGYFDALGIPLRQGRRFTDADTADSLPVIVINEAMARKFWPGLNPIGRRMTMGPNDRWITVIGVVADVRQRELDAPPRTEMYRPHTQFRYGISPEARAADTMTWVVRTSGDPRAAASDARAAVHRVDPGLGVSDVLPMTEVVADSTSDRRMTVLMFALLGGLALVLAAVGIYGVVAYSVTERTHEIGVRMAIGARAEDVRRMVLAQGLTLGLAGVAIGLALALGAARLIRGLLFQVRADDPVTFALVATALLAVTAAASYLPARRATRVDPMVAMRGE